MTTEEKIIDKIRKLHAKAESCEKIGSQEEAEAFAGMVNQLLLKHNLSMSEVDWDKREDTDPICQVWVDFKSQGIASKKARQQWSEHLAGIIARAHFCKILISTGSNRICLIGHKSDREIAEYLFVTMYKLAEKMAEKEYVKYFYECRDNGDVTEARGFKSAWLHGFVLGLSKRFDAERNAAAPSGSTALVRLNRALIEVNDWMKNLKGLRSVNRLNQFRHNVEGQRRGEQMANEVSLRANALRHNPGQGQRVIGH